MNPTIPLKTLYNKHPNDLYVCYFSLTRIISSFKNFAYIFTYTIKRT